MNKLIKFWFMQVSRGYSLPMSITNWLVVFALGILNNGNTLYGILALIGFMCAHLGTNVFDDVIDHWKKVPKQKYKSVHLDNGDTDLKSILILAICYFAIALLIGGFLIFKCGILVALFALLGGIIALLYPILNNYSLGEVAVFSTFGPLLFMGTYYVMTGTINPTCIFISIPVGILTVVVLMIHSLMDYDFDINTQKKTLCLLMGSKINALNLIFAFILIAYLITLFMMIFGYLPFMAVASFGTIPVVITLYRRMYMYINTSEHAQDDFIVNFSLARNIDNIYCIAIMATFFIQKVISLISLNIAPYKMF